MFYFIIISLSFKALALERLDPHGLQQLNIKDSQNAPMHQSCMVCHKVSAKGKVTTKKVTNGLCLSCHNKAPHSGVLEHKKVSCLGCHSPHRSENKNKQENCIACHNVIKKNKFDHLRHVESFKKFEISCQGCHDFSVKAKSDEPTAEPVKKGHLKTKGNVCLNCHGDKPSEKFQQACMACHTDKAEVNLNHSLDSKRQCLDCHQFTKFEHQSLKAQNSDFCTNCHSEQSLRHRDVSIVSHAKTTNNQRLMGSKIKCSSCHKMHGASRTDNLLITKNDVQKFCANCHGEKSKELFQEFHIRINKKK